MRFADGRAAQSAIEAGAATRANLLREWMLRAQAENPRLRAFSELVPAERALERAAARDRTSGRTLASPVDGLSLSVKGCIPVAGQLWTEGSRLFAGRIASDSAKAVRLLEAAGTSFVGMITMSELAMYAPDNPFEPMGLNPWCPDRTCGGSTSGGGVAAAIGAAVLNLGTDAGGSIRNPACHCGVVGFKPTLGRWPFDGVANYAPTVSTLGVIVRSVPDAVAVDDVLAGGETLRAPADAAFLVPERLVAQYADDVTRQLFAGVLDRLRAQGFRIEPFDEPLWEAGERAAGTVSLAEAATHLRTLDEALMAPALARRLRLGRALPVEQVEAARAAMASFGAALQRGVPPGAVVLTPTWPFRAPRIHQTAVVVQGRRMPMDPHRNIFVRAANAADAPALTLPAGFYPGRVPFGVQLMAPQGRDHKLLAVADGAAATIGGVRPEEQPWP